MLDKLKADFDGILELVNKCPADPAGDGLQDHPRALVHGQHDCRRHRQRITERARRRVSRRRVVPRCGEAVPNGERHHDRDAREGIPPHGAWGAAAGVRTSPAPGKPQAGQLAILLCVRQALETGAFTCTLKELREMAVHYDAYDSANFSANLKQNKNYFDRATRALT